MGRAKAGELGGGCIRFCGIPKGATYGDGNI
jgi:hypothetical protein